MKLNRALTAAAYLVALTLIILPLVEVTMSVWPLRFGETAWRYGTFGLLSQAATTPIVGAIMLFATAYALGHRRTLLFSGIMAAVVALALLIGLPVFALDAVQMRTQVRAQTMRAFDLSSVLATIKLSILFAVFLLLAVGSIKATRGRRPERVREEPLIRT